MFPFFARIALAALTLIASPAFAQDRDTDEAAILHILETGPLNIGSDLADWQANFHPDWTVWFAGDEAARARGAHMQLVEDYVASGAYVSRYELDLVRLDILDDMAIARYHAKEYVEDPEQGQRIINYAATTVLVRENGRWLIRTSSLTFPRGYELSAE